MFCFVLPLVSIKVSIKVPIIFLKEALIELVVFTLNEVVTFPLERFEQCATIEALFRCAFILFVRKQKYR